MNTKLYVGNLLYEIQEQDLLELFQQYGQVLSAEIVRYKKSGRSKGFGFVTMATPEQAEAALQALQEYDLRGRKLMLGMAKSTGEKTGEGDQSRTQQPQSEQQARPVQQTQPEEKQLPPRQPQQREEHIPPVNHTPYVQEPQVQTEESVRTEEHVQTVEQPSMDVQTVHETQIEPETYETLTPPAMNEPEMQDTMEEQQMADAQQTQMHQAEEQAQAQRNEHAMESAQSAQEDVEEKQSIFDHMKKYGTIFNRKDRNNN